MTDVQTPAPDALSFEVRPHPSVSRPDAWLAGALKTSLDVAVYRNLHKGQLLHVVVTTPEGEVIAETKCVVGPIGFDEITDRGNVIGTVRVHKAKAQ
jgi:hypothetical protein